MEEKFKAKFEQAKEFLKNKNFKITDTKLMQILAAVEKNYPLLLVGPTGCGKTLLLTHLAEFLKGKYFYQSLNGSVTIHDLTQERILDKDGSFSEQDMVLAEWLRASEKGKSILHFDEVNAAKPETLLAMHPIMDIKGELKLPYSDEILKVNDNAILVMSCNEGDEYIGINAMNAAFQNRFVKVHLGYLQSNELIELLAIKTNVSQDDTKKVVEVWEKYMSSKEPEQPIVSIRMLERWCELSHLIGLKQAGIVTFASLIAENEEDLAMIEQGDFFVMLPDEN